MAALKTNKLTISYVDWISYIKIKKHKILRKIDTTSILDNSIENKTFINILKNIFSTDIFDISRIGYIAFSFLDTYINPYLVNILKNDKQLNYYFLNHKDYDNNDNNDNNGNKKLNDDINNILELIINFIIQTEFSLNLHLFLIIYLLTKNASSSEKVKETKSPYEKTTPKLLKPVILLKFEQIYNNISLNIKPSSVILLLLKINYKLTNILDNININNYNKIIKNELEFYKHIRELNKKINTLLDSFILEITKILDQSQIAIANANTTAIPDKDIIEKYSICINYILDLGNLFYTSFDTVFEIFIKYLKKEYPDNKTFDTVKFTISNFIKQELSILETKLLAT